MNEHLQDDHEKVSSASNIDPSSEESVYNCMTLPEELPTLTCTVNDHLSEVFEVLSKEINQCNTEFNKAVLALQNALVSSAKISYNVQFIPLVVFSLAKPGAELKFNQLQFLDVNQKLVADGGKTRKEFIPPKSYQPG